MSVLVAAIATVLAAQTPPPDPNRLPIGRKGERTVTAGQNTNLGSGNAATAADIAAAARGKRFVFLGENHATAPHQQFHADVIQALVDDGREVIVGLEMYTRPKQDWLDQWSAGKLDESTFLAQSDWKGQWGYPYEFYRPVFEAVKKNHLGLVALNVPREWVRSVGRGGYAGLTTDIKLQLPDNLGELNPPHKEIFGALMGGHPMTGPQGDNMYSAQVLWDQGMADTAIKYLERAKTSPKTVFVVIAGSGHVMYGQGINYRIARRKAGTGITVVKMQSDEPTPVAKGLADFVYVTKPKPAHR